MRRWLPILLLSLSPCINAQAPDWTKANEEALRHFQALIRIDTTDPPGNETRVVDYVKKVLEAEGIPVHRCGQRSGRANLIARISGNGSKRPLLIMGHSDTVKVDASKWTFPPFSAARDGGYIYGRGTLDDKDNLTAAHDDHAAAQTQQADSGPRRDLRFRSWRGSCHGAGHRLPGERSLERHRRRDLSCRRRQRDPACKGRSASRWFRPAKSCPWQRVWSPKVRLAMAPVLCATTRSSIFRARSTKSRCGIRRCGLTTPPAITSRSWRTVSTPEEAARYNGLFDAAEGRGHPRVFGRT